MDVNRTSTWRPRITPHKYISWFKRFLSGFKWFWLILGAGPGTQLASTIIKKKRICPGLAKYRSPAQSKLIREKRLHIFSSNQVKCSFVYLLFLEYCKNYIESDSGVKSDTNQLLYNLKTETCPACPCPKSDSSVQLAWCCCWVKFSTQLSRAGVNIVLKTVNSQVFAPDSAPV